MVAPKSTLKSVLGHVIATDAAKISCRTFLALATNKPSGYRVQMAQSLHDHQPPLAAGAALTLLALLLSGCAAPEGKYPSLAIRDAERVDGSSAVVTAPITPSAEIPLSGAVTARLAQLQAAATTAHQTFLNAVPAATRLVSAASGAGVTTDRWADAQIALANLDSARSQAAIPLADLDVLHADAVLALEHHSRIVETRAAVIAMIAEQDRILSNLRSRMPS